MAGTMLVKIHDYGENITPWQDRHNLLLSYENSIRKDIAKIQESFVYIGLHLCDISDLGLYDTVYYQGAGRYCKDVLEYAYQELDIARTTTYNLMAVAREFADKARGVLPEYKDYTFSQLVELLSFDSEQRKYADPHLSVKQLRLLKKGEKVFWINDGHIIDVSLPKKIKESCPDVGTKDQDKFDKEFDNLMSSLDSLIDGTAAKKIKEDLKQEKNQNEQEEYVQDQLVFYDMMDLSRWFYANYSKSSMYPIVVTFTKLVDEEEKIKGGDQMPEEK